MAKLVTGIVLGVLGLIFMVMNSSLIELRLYFWIVSIPLSIVLILVLGTGMGIGYILNGLRIRKNSQ